MGRRGAGRRLNDQERMEILDIMATEAKVKNVDLAKRYGVSEGAIRKLKQIKDTIRDRYVLGNEQNRDKRKRGGFRRNAQFEQELYEWICRMRETQAYQLIPLTQTAVRQQAIILAKNYETMATFKASPGWFARFCSRHRLDPPMASATSELGVNPAAPASGISAASITEAVNASVALLSSGVGVNLGVNTAAAGVVRAPGQEATEAAMIPFPQAADDIRALGVSDDVVAALAVAGQLVQTPQVEKATGEVDLNCPEAIVEEQTIAKQEDPSKADSALAQVPAQAPAQTPAQAPAPVPTETVATRAAKPKAAAQPPKSLEADDEIFSLGL
ncbi:Heat shock factor protein 2 [Globisporangium polare]